MTKGLMSFFQHSNTPSLHYSKAETFKNFWQPLNNLFICYNSEKIYRLALFGITVTLERVFHGRSGIIDRPHYIHYLNKGTEDDYRFFKGPPSALRQVRTD